MNTDKVSIFMPKKIISSALIIFVSLLVVFIAKNNIASNFLGKPYLKSKVLSASVENIPPVVNLSGTAWVINSADLIYFTGYNANVTLSNDSHQFSGYAWSTDAGWVAFGSSDNPDGPVAFDNLTGNLSGKAKILSTQEDIDFNSSPYSSNVKINIDGTLSGYAWGNDLGWIDFGNTKAEGVSIGILPQSGSSD